MILGIYGCGGAGRETLDIAKEQDRWKKIVFIDDAYDVDIFNGVQRMPFCVFCDRYSTNEAEIIITIGEPRVKSNLYKRVSEAGFCLTNIIHKFSWISPYAILGRGLIIKNGVTINAGAVVGDNVAINEGTCISHDVVLGESCQIAGMTAINGNCKIGDTVYVATNVSIKEGITIGRNSVIGMGAVVSKNIPENVVAVGTPARIIKKIDNSYRVFKTNF